MSEAPIYEVVDGCKMPPEHVLVRVWVEGEIQTVAFLDGGTWWSGGPIEVIRWQEIVSAGKPAWSSKELLDVWLHQNQLVWSRLQTIALLQVAVISGWWYSIGVQPLNALAVSGLGAVLTALIMWAIKCDLGARDNVDTRLWKSGLALPTKLKDYPQMDGKTGRGKRTIWRIVWTLLLVDLLLVLSSFPRFSPWQSMIGWAQQLVGRF